MLKGPGPSMRATSVPVRSSIRTSWSCGPLEQQKHFIHLQQKTDHDSKHDMHSQECAALWREGCRLEACCSRWQNAQQALHDACCDRHCLRLTRGNLPNCSIVSSFVNIQVTCPLLQADKTRSCIQPLGDCNCSEIYL